MAVTSSTWSPSSWREFPAAHQVEWPDDAVAEAARVLRPGGTFVVSVDNRTRAVFLLDPWLNPYLDPLRRGVKALVGRRNGTAVRATGHTMGEVRAFLERHGFDEVRTHSIGFGPFTLGRREVLPRPVGMRLQAGLQRVADRNGSRVRLLGSQYLVVATKRDCREA
jgi:SAM-dependent methyltransferase